MEVLMSGVMDLVGQLTQGDTLKRLSGQLGMDEDALGKGIGAAGPLLVAALARNAAAPDGARKLDAALDAHDGAALDDLPRAVGDADTADGEKILGHVLGDRLDGARAAIARAAGTSDEQAGQLLATLAPLVMGAVGRLRREEGLDASSLPSRLAEMRDGLEHHGPEIMAFATQLLDRNQDGSIADEVGGFVGKLFGKR
jgi:hypothetical protein